MQFNLMEQMQYLCQENTHFICATWRITAYDSVTNVTVIIRGGLERYSIIKYDYTYYLIE